MSVRKWIRALAAWALVIGMIPAMPVKAEEELNLDGESAVLIDADSGAVLMRKTLTIAIILPVLQKL